ncbi:MAG: hypothetical protein HY579_01665 [Nitrospinae bacterium]|nr:hypothetical protein [Nitrospinota bacterium]
MVPRFYQSFLSNFLVAFLGVFLLGAGELVLRICGVGSDFDLVVEGDTPAGMGKYSLNSQYVALHYFRHLPVKLTSLFKESPWFPDTEFSRKKAPGTYRIFLVGASTTRGFPFNDRKISYSGFLGQILKDVLPGHAAEVVNAGYDAISSYGVEDIFRQLLEYDPDLIVVYSGHNEFIGHFGANSKVNFGNRFVNDLTTRLYRSRLFFVSELLTLKLASLAKPESSRSERVNMFKVMMKENKMTWTGRDHADTLENYERNLGDMARMAKEKRVRVIFSTLASNLRDFSPVRSEADPNLGPAQRTVFMSGLQKAREAMAGGGLDEAIAFFREVQSVDPHYAQEHFELARAYERKGDYRRAHEEYVNAREDDKVHLRACVLFNQAVERVGKTENAPVIDMETELERLSPNGLIGSNFFLEHVHPNINGHLIMADALARFLARNDFIEPQDRWDWSRLRSAREYVRESGFDKKRHVSAQYMVGRLLLDFPFYKCAEGVEYLEQIGAASEEKDLIGQCYERAKAPEEGAVMAAAKG